MTPYYISFFYKYTYITSHVHYIHTSRENKDEWWVYLQGKQTCRGCDSKMVLLKTIIACNTENVSHFWNSSWDFIDEMSSFRWSNLLHSHLFVGNLWHLITWRYEYVNPCTYIQELDTLSHLFQLCYSSVLVAPTSHCASLLWFYWTLVQGERTWEKKEACVFC